MIPSSAKLQVGSVAWSAKLQVGSVVLSAKLQVGSIKLHNPTRLWTLVDTSKSVQEIRVVPKQISSI